MQSFQQWPRNIRLFFIANILYQIGGGMFSVLYNLYIQSLGYSESMTGNVVSLQSLATALMFIPVGLLGDRLSRKWMLMAGALVSGAVFIGRSLLEAQSGMLLFAVLSGIFAAFFQVLAIPFLAENVSISKRLRMFSYYSSLVLAAQVIGSLGGGVIADLLQSLGFGRTASLQAVLMVGGISTLASFLPLIRIAETSGTAASMDSKPQATGHAADAARPGRDHVLITQFVITQLLIGFGSGLVIPYLNLYFTNRFDVSWSGMSLLLALGQVMTILSMLVGPYLAGRLGPVKAVVCFQMLSLPFLLVTGFTNMLWAASVSFLFRQALMNAANPIQSAIMMDKISVKRRGTANSLMQTAFMLGWATMGPVQSHLVTTYGNYWGYAITFSITGLLYVVSSLLYYIMFRERRTSAAAGINK
ncbi:MFS transporter [Paenibacillus sp. P96]|uniref:MFS transporter n=1 Tax=Paenibacillus zeirhizosphaerae TaxID=2987519 RepID=A0ABT9FSF8_9BACL|nr:MFS transporter [Paenibacillus sp. P96]MDP4097615.1 MFS transporter [Paenibacillus sp. P96]